MDNSIITQSDRINAPSDLMRKNSDTKDTINRISQYLDYQALIDRPWWQPDLDGYVDWLQTKHQNANTSISSKIGTVRSRLNGVLQSGEFKRCVWRNINGANLAEAITITNEFVSQTITDMKDVQVKLKDRSAVAKGYRMSNEEIEYFLSAPDLTRLSGVRDQMTFALLLATGARSSEVLNITYTDLSKIVDGQRVCHIREGKGFKERYVVFGDYWRVYVEEYILPWVVQFNVKPDEYLISGVDKHNNRVPYSQISHESLRQMGIRYPLHNGYIIKPHDLRRTYARQCYDLKMDIYQIKDNMGHDKIQTTLGYIGPTDMKNRAVSIPSLL